jgi:8-oxo-dGTP pyrophosphatase MutT (NUDIX family)
MTVRARRAARVFLVDDAGCVLLFRGMDPARPEAGTWWLTPGGGIEGDETIEAGARRELFEETGFVADALGEPVYERRTRFSFEGIEYAQHETFFRLHVTRFTPVTTGWEDSEVRSMTEHRWWSLEELAATDETIYPERLVSIMTEWVG